RVLISRQGLETTGLVQPGTRVTHRHLLKLPDGLSSKAVQAELAATFPDKTVRVSTYQDAQPTLRRFLRQLTMYQGLAGLIALMVGGIGVASSVRAFMKEKLETIAVLKAIGAGSGTILRVYLTQTFLLGVLGCLAGAVLGAAFQVALPPLLRAWLPIDLEFRLALLPFVRGVGMGLLTTVLFALWPLLEVRHVRPNLILRREVADEPAGSPGRMAWAISGLLALALAGMALWQAGSWRAARPCLGAVAAGPALPQAPAGVGVRPARPVPRGRSVSR